MKKIFLTSAFIILLFYNAYSSSTEISLYIGGSNEQYYRVNVINDKILYQAGFSSDENKLKQETLKTTKEQIEKFIQRLKSIGIETWHSYYIDAGIADGTQWEIIIKSRHLNKNISGSNEYPDKFEEYLKAVQNFIGKKEFK